MEIKVRDKETGKIVRTVKVRDTHHFNHQLNTRGQVVESKKKYKRSRDKYKGRD